MTTNTKVLIGLGGLALAATIGYAYYSHVQSKINGYSKIDKLIAKVESTDGKGKGDVFKKMNAQELSDSYDMIFDYIPNKKQPTGDYKTRMLAIAAKYNIFN